MDSSLVFILDTCWGGRKELFIRRNKQTGEGEHIGECLKALNYFNKTMDGMDCWDLICAPKHSRYSVEMYGHVGKWTVGFGDCLCYLLQANGFFCCRAVNIGNNDIRRRSQTKFITKALEEGLK
eukprot:2807247-Ditylum_brightwellii.AAC.1